MPRNIIWFGGKNAVQGHNAQAFEPGQLVYTSRGEPAITPEGLDQFVSLIDGTVLPRAILAKKLECAIQIGSG